MKKTEQTARNVKRREPKGWLRFGSRVVLMLLVVLVACAPQTPETEVPSAAGVEPSASPSATPAPEGGVAASPPQASPEPTAEMGAQGKERAEDDFRCEVGIDPQDPEALICTGRGEEVAEVIVKVPPELQGVTPQKLRWPQEQLDNFTIIRRVINLRIVDAEGNEVQQFRPGITFAVPYTREDLARYREANLAREFALGYWDDREERWVPFYEQPNEFKFVPALDDAFQDGFICDQEGSREPFEEGGFGCATIFAMPDPRTLW